MSAEFGLANVTGKDVQSHMCSYLKKKVILYNNDTFTNSVTLICVLEYPILIALKSQSFLFLYQATKFKSSIKKSEQNVNCPSLVSSTGFNK